MRAVKALYRPSFVIFVLLLVTQLGCWAKLMHIGVMPAEWIMWRVIAMHEDGSYDEGFYSLLDGDRPMRFTRYEVTPSLREHLGELDAVQRLVGLGVLGVGDTPARGHQVHLAGPDDDVAAQRISVPDLAAEQPGDICRQVCG